MRRPLTPRGGAAIGSAPAGRAACGRGYGGNTAAAARPDQYSNTWSPLRVFRHCRYVCDIIPDRPHRDATCSSLGGTGDALSIKHGRPVCPRSPSAGRALTRMVYTGLAGPATRGLSAPPGHRPCIRELPHYVRSSNRSG